MCSVLGTKEFLEDLKKFFKFNRPINLAGSQEHPNNAFKITYSCKQALEVSSILYKNSKIYLDRKYLKYLEFCRLYEESYRGLEGKNGELWDENTVLNSEITKGSESV